MQIIIGLLRKILFSSLILSLEGLIYQENKELVLRIDIETIG